MPFRPQQLDTGFVSYPQPQPEVKPVERVTTLESIGALFQGDTATLSRATQESVDTIGAAFRMENDIVNAVDWLTRPQYQPDPTFDVQARLKADGLWNDYADNFLGVQSEAEYLAVSGRIAREEKDRATLAASGAGGVIAMMAAGIVSPAALIPFVGGARGAKAIGLGVAAGLAGGAAQEIPLQLAQETRTLEESVSSIALSTVVGGVLGGAVAYARRTPKEIARLFDMAVDPRAGAIPKLRSAGAAAQDTDVHLASSFQLNETVGQISPVVRALTSRFQQGRWMMAKLADAGLEFADKRVAALGGNVENRIKTYYGPVDKVLRQFDEGFATYWFGPDASRPFAVQRANLAGLNPRREKMSRKEFAMEIGRALQQGDTHQIPEVQALARAIRAEIYDPIAKRAEEVGLLGEVKSQVPGDLSYLNRVYRTDMIQARQKQFEEIIASHYEQKLVDEFRASFGRLNVQQLHAEERAADFSRTPEEVVALRKQFEEQLLALDEGRNAELVELEDAISDKRTAARAFDRGTPEREAALAEARALEQSGGEALAQTRAARADIRRRLANLRRAHAALTERQAKKLDKIARAEELSYNTLARLTRKGQKLLNELESMTDAKYDAEIGKLKTDFAQAAARYDRNEERIAKLFDDEFENDVPTSPFVQAAKVETETFTKMSDIAEALEEAEVFDRSVARAQVEAMLEDATRRAQSIVERRAVRSARLEEQARQLDPEAAARQIAETQEGMRLRKQEFLEQWRERGADDIDPATGVANFKRYAADAARQTTNRILGTYMRLPGIDMIMQPRGAELARTLDIDSRLLVDPDDGQSFLEMDVEKLMMTYVRTMAPDIELTRAFGSFAPDKELNENWQKLNEEMVAVKTQEQDLMRQGVDPKTGKKKTFTTEQIDKRGLEITKEYDDLARDMEAVIGRLRHTWGVPTDPRGFGARAARIASNINVLRFMSNVAISSIPDLARPIMKYGLLRTFRNGYVPFVKALAEGNFTPRQLRIAGAALDVTLHSRAAQVYDIGDYMVRGSKFEKGLDYATSKIGLIGLFDYWTAAMKQMSGAVANARAMDAINIVAGGAKASQRDLDEAVRFLSANGIDDDYAQRIWKELQKPGASDRVGGQLWPNTDMWEDADAVTAYNAMLVREVDNSIITPGVERPLMVDANPYQRLLFQFKSFGMSSTTKTFLAGAQGMRQGDMAFVTGGVISLALGTLSYYIASSIAGGAQKERMEAAFRTGDWGRFADEAINRSGLLGIGADLQSAFAATPLAPYVTFSGERTTRRGGDNLLESVIGPTYGGLAPDAADIISGTLGAVTEQDASMVPGRALRTLAPFQNHFLLRHLYDQIEAAGGNLPERRQ